jgi:hypothetical protein
MNPFTTDIFTEPADIDSNTLANLGPRGAKHHPDRGQPRR